MILCAVLDLLIYHFIGGWANENPSCWDEIIDKLAENELNSVDDVLVDWKFLFKGAIKKGDDTDLIAHLSKGGRARDTGFITFALPGKSSNTMNVHRAINTNFCERR